MKEFLQKEIEHALVLLDVVGVCRIEAGSKSMFGDFSTNVALSLYQNVKNQFKSPHEFGQYLVQTLQKNDEVKKRFSKITVDGPGFINFFLSHEYLLDYLYKAVDEGERFGLGGNLSGKKLMVEFAHPNTHKLFHIGHLRNITVGEAVSKLLESQEAHVVRANYQGDVGMHIAKALWGAMQRFKRDDMLKEFNEKALDEKVQFLATSYVEGNKAYEEKQECKSQIEELNKKLYQGDPTLTKLWKTTRAWSLTYFDQIYRRVGTQFDRLYFESEVADLGKKLVLEYIDRVFIKDQGAVIFPGKNYGLHNRVFINQLGLPTYEGKDIGLAHLQRKEYSPDAIIHVVGPEQAGYFEVVFKALECMSDEFKNKEKHLLYGFVQLKEGKMSSRRGEVVEGEWLLDEAARRILAEFPEMDGTTAEKVALAAVKYSFLKFSTPSDMQFSFDESISLEGNSGPYLQYTYVRTQSVIKKSNPPWRDKDQTRLGGTKIKPQFNQEEFSLLRLFPHFPEVVAQAAEHFAPNLLCNYLFNLAQQFNLFYQKNPILKGENKEFRLALTAAVGQVLRNGLDLLGIQVVEKM